MPQPTIGNSDATLSTVRRQRSPVMRSVVFLLISAGALLIFIALLGDWRREHNTIAQLKKYAAEYSSRLGEGGILPLNLELDAPRDPKLRLMDAWLSPAEAKGLRGTDRRVLAAWTVPLVRVLGTDGRGVVFFEHGRFNAEWVPLRRFDAMLLDQVAELRRLATPPS